MRTPHIQNIVDWNVIFGMTAYTMIDPKGLDILFKEVNRKVQEQPQDTVC